MVAKSGSPDKLPIYRYSFVSETVLSTTQLQDCVFSVLSDRILTRNCKMTTITRHAAKQAAAANANASNDDKLVAEEVEQSGPAGPKKTVAMDAIAGLQSTLERAMREMAQVNTNLYDKLEQADARSMDLEIENGRLDREAREHARQYEDLRRALQDMENRERRNNLRLMGVKEEASFRSFLEKEKVLTAAIQRSRGRRGIMWNNCKISFFPNLTRDVVEKRKKFTEVRMKLHDLDIHFTLAYPAVLRFTWKGKRKRLDDPRKQDVTLTFSTVWEKP
ncbi:hypothetical protein WMY93_010402 [Mugilogobius chulae]|uniref:Uncharacterized protein n=1 Tax=Mugilogobius chulae TaxID=88201 RepID=A0AAW0P7F3_9GOBI